MARPSPGRPARPASAKPKPKVAPKAKLKTKTKPSARRPLPDLRDEELRVLHQISRVSLAAQDIKEALREIVELIRAATDFPIVAVELYDEGRDRLLHRAVLGTAATEDDDTLPHEAIAGLVVRAGRRLVESGPAYDRHGIQTLISVPMKVGEQIIGALTLAHPDRIAIDPSLPEWAETLANHLAELTERLHIEQLLHSRKARLESLINRVRRGEAKALSDRDLLTYLLMPLTRGDEGHSLATRLLSSLGSLGEVLNAAPAELEKLRVTRRLMTVFAVVREVAARMLRSEVLDSPVLDTWDRLVDYCRLTMGRNRVEQIRILYLDRRNQLIADEVIHQGTVDRTDLYPREIIRRALEVNATAFVMVHNHPSGDPRPSPRDIKLTKELAGVAASLGIVLHDHVVVSRQGYSSLKAMGLL